MSDIAICAEALGKRYRIGKTVERVDGHRRLTQLAAAPFQYLLSTLREPPQNELIWALRDVSFEVKQGQVLGIIGRNGAGKSTLLKILSRITEPSQGRAVIHGRVGSLLEVGTGFHPQLTGRENIYLNGAILGMKKIEIDRKFDEIVAFSEVERFIDTPVKRYSSGMYVRLAFAVAAHLEPEILLVDEVLAVGDASFQKKCLGKMGDVANEGRTVLFVSHNMIALQSLCKQALWLNQGQVVEEGESDQVISNYLQTSLSLQTEQVWANIHQAPGNDKVRLRRVCIRPENGTSSELITMHSPLVMEVEYWNLVPNARLHITLHVYAGPQVIAFTTGSCHSDTEWAGRPAPVGLYRSVCRIPGDFLNSGIHRVLVLVVANWDTVIYQHEDAVAFDVHDLDKRPGAWYGKEPGIVAPTLDWKTEYLDDIHPPALSAS